MVTKGAQEKITDRRMKGEWGEGSVWEKKRQEKNERDKAAEDG